MEVSTRVLIPRLILEGVVSAQPLVLAIWGFLLAKKPTTESNKNSLGEVLNPDEKKIDWSQRRRVFAIFVSLNIFMNADTGIIPCSLLQISEEMDLSFQQQAYLGSLVYVGLSSASLIVSPIYAKYSVKNVISIMILANICFCILLSFSYHLYLIYVARIGMGFTQAFCIIYGPVWTNEFAPPQSTTSWMAYLQGAVPLGVVSGYLSAGVIVNYMRDIFTWRQAIQLQAITEVPILLALLAASKSSIELPKDEPEQEKQKEKPAVDPPKSSSGAVARKKTVRTDTVNIGEWAGFVTQFRVLCDNWVFITVTGGLCCMYFVGSGIQYWLTAYMIVILEADPVVVLIAFTVSCITAPIMGVMLGGFLADWVGGYKGRNTINAIRICVAFSIFGMIFAFPVGFVGSLYYILPLLWMLLFFGAAIIPTATGVVVNSVPREYQSASSSISQLAYNIFGYFLAPIASALVMDSYEDEREGMIWGFRTVLLGAAVGLLFMLIAWIAVYRQFAYYEEMDEEVEELGDVGMIRRREFAIEILRRRTHSYSF